jgi:predicted transcriptional regulator of viral defense system
MKTDLLQHFERIPYFTIEGFKQVSGMDDPHQVRVLLHRWARAGHMLPLKKGMYMTRRFHDGHHRDPQFLPAVSAILLPHSYLSLEFMLQRHNLLTEVTHPITCITTKNTRKITNSIGTFWYRHIREDLFYGFIITEYFGIQIAEASPAKALFDHLYLRPLPAFQRDTGLDLAGELRLNLEELSATDRDEFSNYVETSQNRKMTDILDNFRRHAWHR